MIPLIDDRGFIITSLSEVLEIYGTEWTSEVLGTFRSVHDSATEAFLKEKAIDMEVRDLSRTYLAIAKDGVRILGYITLSIKCMRVPDENLPSGKTRKSMNIDSRTNIVQSYLIGQLSRSADAPKGLGGYLLDVAFEKLDQARGIVGCKVVRLDCHDELIDYYKAHGFRLITTNDDRSLNQMMAFIVPKRRMGISKRKSPELLLNALLHHPHLDIEVLVVPSYDNPILPTTTATYSVFGHPSQPFQMLAQTGRGAPPSFGKDEFRYRFDKNESKSASFAG